MYRGKFDSKYKGSGTPYVPQREPRQAAPAAQPQRPVRQSAPQPQPQQAVPARRGPRIGGVIFYTFYFLFIFLFFVGTYFGLLWLHDFLEKFELAQPTVQSKEVFEEYFSDPDWEKLYNMAGEKPTAYEGVEEFVAYMEAKVGDQELNMVETSAGLSGGKKYFVRAGSEKVASFTLTAGEDVDLNDMTQIPEWELGAVEVFYECTESYMIQKQDGHTATVNGVALDDTFTIERAYTVAKDYLPIDAVGNRTAIQYIDGLMFLPEVKILDENGNEMEVIYDEASRTFVEQIETVAITEDLKTVAIDACKAYSLFMIEAVYGDSVAKYFDTTSDIYKMIVRSDRWMQDYSDYRFGNEQVSDYVRYADDLFSAKVSLSLYVTRTNGTVREYKVDDTLFFELQSTGKWLVFDKTNEDVSTRKGEVRITFIDGDTQISSEFYDTDSKELTIPVPAAPTGKVFTGWYRKDVNENGTTTATVIFTPDENGHVGISGYTLEPMTLYALYQSEEEASANGGAA